MFLHTALKHKKMRAIPKETGSSELKEVVGYDPLLIDMCTSEQKRLTHTVSSKRTQPNAIPRSQNAQGINPINLRLLFFEPRFISHKTLHLLQARQ